MPAQEIIHHLPASSLDTEHYVAKCGCNFRATRETAADAQAALTAHTCKA